MKWAWIVALSLYDSAPPLVPGVEVAAGVTELRDVGGVLLHRGVPFSGFVVEAHARIPYLEGRMHGWAVAHHANGALRHRKFYRAGHREGRHQGWWANGQLQFDYRYAHDLFEGEQRAYHGNGTLAELRHYQMGHEEGLQRVFDPTGRIVANYTFKDGRRYGIVGRTDCVSR